MATIKKLIQAVLLSQPATIASGGTDSAAIDLAGLTLCGILLPAAFTGTTLSFLVSDALAGTYVPLKSSASGTLLSYTVAQATYAALDPKDFQGVNFLKLKSGSSEGADRALTLMTKGF